MTSSGDLEREGLLLVTLKLCPRSSAACTIEQSQLLIIFDRRSPSYLDFQLVFYSPWCAGRRIEPENNPAVLKLSRQRNSHLSVDDAVSKEDGDSLERGKDKEQPLYHGGVDSAPYHQEPQGPRNSQDWDQHHRCMNQSTV